MPSAGAAPYAACLHPGRGMARRNEPSMINIATSHSSPFLPNRSRPSTPSSPAPIELILFWNAEDDGARNRPAALALAGPASRLCLIPATSLYIQAATNSPPPHAKGRPLLPLFSSSGPPSAVPSPTSNA